MSKNYILEPTVLPNDGNEGEFYLAFEEIPFDLNSLNESVLCEVSDGTILKYAGFDDSDGGLGYCFTTNGQLEYIEPWVSIFDTVYDGEVEKSVMYGNGLCNDLSVTISIYTKTEDNSDPGSGLSKNLTHNDHPYNAVERIRSKLKQKAEQGDGGSSGGLKEFKAFWYPQTVLVSESSDEIGCLIIEDFSLKEGEFAIINEYDPWGVFFDFALVKCLSNEVFGVNPDSLLGTDAYTIAEDATASMVGQSDGYGNLSYILVVTSPDILVDGTP